MRIRSFLVLSCAALFIAMTSAPIAVQAATNLNSSKSNIYKPIANADDEAACVKAGGKVETKDGKKVCALPATPTTTPSPASTPAPEH